MSRFPLTFIFVFLTLFSSSVHSIWPFSFSEKESTDSSAAANIFKLFNSDLTALPSSQSVEFLPPGNNEEFFNVSPGQQSSGESVGSNSATTGTVALGEGVPKQKSNRFRFRQKQQQVTVGQPQQQQQQQLSVPQNTNQQFGGLSSFFNPFGGQNLPGSFQTVVIDENGQPVTLNFNPPQQPQQPKRSFNPLKWVFPALITIGGQQQQQTQPQPVQTVVVDPGYFHSQPSQQQVQPQQYHHHPTVISVSHAAPVANNAPASSVFKPKVSRQPLNTFSRTRTVSGTKGQSPPPTGASPQVPAPPTVNYNEWQHPQSQSVVTTPLLSSEPQYGYRVQQQQQPQHHQEQQSAELKPTSYVVSRWEQQQPGMNPVVRVFNILNDTGYHHQITTQPAGQVNVAGGVYNSQQQPTSSGVQTQSSAQPSVQISPPSSSSSSGVTSKPQGGDYETDTALEGFESRPMPTYVATSSISPSGSSNKIINEKQVASVAENGFATKREDVQLPSSLEHHFGSSSSDSEAKN